LTVSLAIIALLFWVAPVSADPQPTVEKEKSSKCFVDLDGDGFDDNAEDQDLDGIPNEVDPDYVQVEAEPLAGYDDFFAADGLEETADVDIGLLTNAQKFCRLRMSVRSLCQRLSAFEPVDEFGVAEEVGSGAVMGGVCQGGVCTVR
jgi:hypothetical protein